LPTPLHPPTPLPQKDGAVTTNFWLSLLLTFFAWFPGQIYAAWHVFLRK
jgi:uncharacterized membrane protein YqaE (UPF0057 family)